MIQTLFINSSHENSIKIESEQKQNKKICQRDEKMNDKILHA